MNPLVFATNNKHKVAEVQAAIKDAFQIKGLKDIGCTEEIPETTNTIEGNAIQKAQYVYDHYNVNCFAEDTGLEIDALNGEPGVHTAYYAGPQRSATDNMALVLSKLKNQSNRSARFKTVIALIIDGKVETFTGVVNGTIASEPHGYLGFGYDPIFIPNGSASTFGEMTAVDKNVISHRGRAVEKLKTYLLNLNP
jgi:XTP/dITP diphosphohydrolase